MVDNFTGTSRIFLLYYMKATIKPHRFTKKNSLTSLKLYRLTHPIVRMVYDMVWWVDRYRKELTLSYYKSVKNSKNVLLGQIGTVF